MEEKEVAVRAVEYVRDNRLRWWAETLVLEKEADDESVECMKLDLERDLEVAPYELLDVSTTGRCRVGVEAKV